ncbi:MAG: hypothetical protein ACTHLW_16115 [Verrucomicrobiota bacterium]
MKTGVDFFFDPQFALIHGIGNYVFLGFLAVIGAFYLTFIIVCLCERQYLTGDIEPVTEPFPFTPSPYWTVTHQEALDFGLHHAGDFATKKKTSIVKGLQSMFLSPDRQTIVAVVSGAAAGAKVKRTNLRSRLLTGRVLESSDSYGTPDFSGVVDRAILLNAGIVELMNFHLQRIQNSGSSAVPFSPSAVLEEYEKFDVERGQRWVLLGLAKWVDPQRTTIRITFRGALRLTKNLFRASAQLKDQQHRTHILRAGAKRRSSA